MFADSELSGIAHLLGLPRENVSLHYGETSMFIRSGHSYGNTEIIAQYRNDMPVVEIHNTGFHGLEISHDFLNRCAKIVMPLMWAKLPFIKAANESHEILMEKRERELLADVAGMFFDLPKRIKDELHLCVTRNPMKKIQAIKEVRELTQWGLAESKCFVEHYSTATQKLVMNRVW